jgi:Domain of unknown function (DUF4129)
MVILKNNIDARMSLIIRLFSLLVLSALAMMFFSFQAYSQAVLRKDTTAVADIRKMDATFIDSVKNERAFQYDKHEMRGLSAWDRFWRWVGYQINQLFEREGYAMGFKIFVWSLAIVITCFAIVKLVGMEKINFWIKGHKSQLTAGDINEENIYGIDFDQAIADAEGRSAYREAVRWLYLKSLRVLADNNLIDWKINKTNIDYATELSAGNHYKDFQQLTRYYEFAWYGEFDLNHQDYQKVSQSFIRFNKTVTG